MTRNFGVAAGDICCGWRSAMNTASASAKFFSCLKKWWRRRESNPRPKMSLVKRLHA